MKKYYFLFLFFLISYFNAQKNDNLNYLNNGIVEDQSGKIITDKKLKENFLNDRANKVLQENRKLRKGATPVLVEMCSNGGFEQVESVGGKNYLKISYTPSEIRRVLRNVDQFPTRQIPTSTNTVPRPII